MADNLTTTTTVSTVPSGSVIATDDVSGVHFQKVKIDVGGDGASAVLGNSNPLPVSDAGGTLSIDDGSGSITVDGTVTANLAAGTNNIGDVDVLSIAAGDNNIGNVDIVTMPAVTNAGTFAVQESGSALTALQLIDDAVYTDGTGTPSKAIGVAGTDGTNPQIIKTDTSGELQVDVLTMPTVAVTQSGTWDEVGINDSGNSITVDNSGTFAVQVDGSALTALQLLDDVVATDGAATPTKGYMMAGQDGTNAQTIKTDSDGNLQIDILTIAAGDNNIGNVDLASAIPAGDNAIGRVKLTDGTDVADVLDLTNSNPLTVAIVDGSGTQITSFGGGTQYTEADTDASITGTAVMWEDGSDTLRAVSSAKPLPVNVVAGGAAGGTSANDDSAFTIGSQAGTPIMGLFDDTGTDSVDENDVGAVRMSGNRNLFTTLRDAAGNERGVNVTAGNALTVDGSAVTQPVSHAALTELAAAIDTELQVDVVGALPAGTNNIGDVDILSIAAGDNNIGNVDIVSLPASTNTIEIVGDAAHDAAVAGNPVLVGVESKDFDGAALPNAVSAEGEVVRASASLSGVLYVMPVNEDGSAVANIGTVTAVTSLTNALPAGTNAIGKLAANSGVDIGDVDITSIAAGDNNIGNVDLASAIPAGTNAIGKLLPPDVDVTAHTNYARKYYANTGAATDGIIWSPAAGKRWHVVSMYLNVSAAATVTLEDDKAGGDDPVWKGEYAANSGVTIYFGEKYPMASGEDAADLLITTTAGNVYVTCVGYEI